MKGYVRSISYWAYCMEKMFCGMLGTVLMLFLVYALMDMDSMNWRKWLYSYIPMIGVIFPLAWGINISNQQIPLALSYGSTRKETAGGVIIMTHATIVQFLALALISNSLIEAAYAMDGYLRACGILFLISCGISNGLGAAILRFGSKAGMIIYIVMIVLFAGGVGIISVLSGLDAVIPFVYSAGLLVTGVVFDVIMAIALYCGIRRYEVRI